MWTFCLLQYVTSLLITETPRVKSVTRRCFSPPLCDQVAPPTMLFSLHAIYLSIHSSSMPTPASCVLLPSGLTTAPSLHHLTPPPRWSACFPLQCFLLSSSNRLILGLLSCRSFLHFHSFFPSLPILHPPLSQPPFSLPVCSDRFCGSRTGCVNVKPFPAMIMFITHCVSRCPWINTDWSSTLQR